jgi:hypothetical protein
MLFLFGCSDGITLDLPQGPKGDPGLSAFEIWEQSDLSSDLNEDGTINEYDFFIFLTGEKGESGTNGDTPYIGSDGNWWIGDFNTGYPATGPAGEQGIPGETPEITIGDNGNWFIDGEDTGISATGPQGPTGQPGANGQTAYELWVEMVLSEEGLDDPRTDAIDKWPVDQISVEDFWLYLRGRDGKNGKDNQNYPKVDVLINFMDIFTTGRFDIAVTSNSMWSVRVWSDFPDAKNREYEWLEVTTPIMFGQNNGTISFNVKKLPTKEDIRFIISVEAMGTPADTETIVVVLHDPSEY